jgi:hypothetical protein
MFIKSGSGTNLDINVVVKVGSDWDWTPGQTLKLNDYEQGKWVSVTVPISSFGSGANLSAVKSLLFQYGATTSAYSGEIYFNNVKIDGTVISDFDDAKAWSLTADNSAVSIVRASDAGTAAPSSSSSGGNSNPSSSSGGSNPSSSSGGSSSSGNNSNPSSSSNSEASPILHSLVPILNSNPPIYYTLKGIPLGETKPSKPGVYIVKEKHSIKKIVVR